MMDKQGHPTFMNPAAETVTGYTLDEIRDMPLHDAIHHHHPDGRPYPMCDCPIDNAQAELVEMKDYEDIFVRKDGSFFPVLCYIAPLDENGKVIGSVLEFRDVTERKKAEELDNLHTNMLKLNAEIGATSIKKNTMRLMLQEFTETLVKRLDVAFARIWTLNKQENMLELQGSAGMYTHIDGDHSRIPVGSFKIGLIAQECKPHLTNDVINDKQISNPEWAKREEMVAFAGHPLIVDGNVVGVMAMFARNPFGEIIIEHRFSHV